MLAVVICIEIFCNGLSCVVQFDDDVTYSKYSGYNNYLRDLRPAVNYVKEHDVGFYRMEKLTHRKYNDNMALSMRGVSNSTSTLNASTLKFLNNMGYVSRSHLSQYKGGTPVSDSLLGVKYLIDNKDSKALLNYYTEIYSDEKYTAYQNPYALSVAYGVNDSVAEFDFSKHYTHFEKQNALVSTMLGEESTLPIYVPVPESDYVESSSGCTVNSSLTQVTYTPVNEDNNASFSYTIVAQYSGEYFFYTPAKTAKETSISVNGSSKGSYLGSNSNHIVVLGYFEEGEEIKVTVTLKEEALTIYRGCEYFWYIDKEVFEDAFSRLKALPQFNIDENYKEDHLTGTITTDKENYMIQTTIPYDEGWNVYVDGEKVEIYQTLDALVAFNITDIGEHTLEMKYSPTSFRLGLILTISGTAIFIVICIADIIIKRLRRKAVTTIDNKWLLSDFDEDEAQVQQLLNDGIYPKKNNIILLMKQLMQKKKISANNDDTDKEKSNESIDDNDAGGI